MAQIRQVVSESLQATIRRLLPSQQGFTEDLQASNVIQPIIDLTPSAEGSTLDTDLARAISFGNLTAFSKNNGTETVINTPGFWKVQAGVSLLGSGSNIPRAEFIVSDGTTDKIIHAVEKSTSTAFSEFFCLYVELTVFLDTGESLKVDANTSFTQITGSYHQVADKDGNLVNPSGFQPS